ncbi:MAG TPA: hypothetical protein VFS95_03410 [Telluria sp.]|nr:hypothetical protein [Telluria sp.]
MHFAYKRCSKEYNCQENSEISDMRAATLFLSLAISLPAPQAAGACAPVRIGYVDQDRPPYFLGNGSIEGQPPGAAVDLLRAIAAAAGCTMVSVRLPPLRLRNALGSGDIDAMLMNATEGDSKEFALPVGKTGKLDEQRAVQMYTVVFVRASDKIGADTDPRRYFLARRLGMNNGASLAAQLRTEGYRVDDGAHDEARNLEKLARGRIDGYAATMVVPTNMDATVAAKFGARLIRLQVPLRTHHFWLAFTKRYYARNEQAVNTMWTWMGTYGDLRFAEDVARYSPAKH